MDALKPITQYITQYMRVMPRASGALLLLGLWLAGFGHNLLHEAHAHAEDMEHFGSHEVCLLADIPQMLLPMPAVVADNMSYVDMALWSLRTSNGRVLAVANYDTRAPPFHS